MRAPRWYAKFNRTLTNRIVNLWAGRVSGITILEHVGRKSGKVYRTPLNAFPIDDGLAVMVGYGPKTDWLRNIRAAGAARVEYKGETFQVVPDSGLLTKREAAQLIRGPWRRFYFFMPFDETLLLKRAA